MHAERHQDRSLATIQCENAVAMWERLCEKWNVALLRAQKRGDLHQAAQAELTLGMCKRERSRVTSMFRMPTRA